MEILIDLADRSREVEVENAKSLLILHIASHPVAEISEEKLGIINYRITEELTDKNAADYMQCLKSGYPLRSLLLQIISGEGIADSDKQTTTDKLVALTRGEVTLISDEVILTKDEAKILSGIEQLAHLSEIRRKHMLDVHERMKKKGLLVESIE